MSEEQDFTLKDNESSSTSDKTVKDAGGVKPPSINFSTFILSLSTSAAMSLGGYQDPQSGHIPKNLEHAKQSIDILAIIQSKTEGNLTTEEKDLLESTLYELRMRYVEEVKKG